MKMKNEKAIGIGIVILLLWGFTGTVSAATTWTVDAATATESSLSSSLQVDFGTIPSADFPLDKGIKHRFKIKNLGDSEFIAEFVVEEVERGARVDTWPQPATLILSPGEEQWLLILFLFDETIDDLAAQYGVGEHTCSLNYTFWNISDTSDQFSLIQNYTFTILDSENITGTFGVQGEVVDENGQPIHDATVVLSTGNYNTATPTPPNGSFSFSVPANSNWFLQAYKDGYKDAYAFNLSDTSQYTLTLALFSEESIQYERVKQVTTDIGFWKYAVDADEQYILLAQGMENWADEDLTVDSELMLYTLDGDAVWTYPMGEEAWGADLSQDGSYAAYVSYPVRHPFPEPWDPGKLGLLDAPTGTVLWEKNLTSENFPFISSVPLYDQNSNEVMFSHDNSYIAIGTNRGDFYLLDRATGNNLWGYPTEGQVRKIIFSNDDSFVYLGSGDGRLYKLATSNGELQWMTHIWAWPFSYGLALSPDESLIAAGVKTGEVSVVRTSDGTRLWDYDFGIMCIHWLAFSPDGTRLAAGSGAPGGTIIFNVTDGSPLWRVHVSGAGMYPANGNRIFMTNGAGMIYTADGTLVTSLDPGFDTDSGYWQVGYISQDQSRIVLAARDMAPDGVGIAFFNKTEALLTTITVSPSTANVSVGGTQQFTATAKDEDGDPMAGVVISWTSTNTSVGTVSPATATTGASGTATTTITAVAIGTTTITATNGSMSDSTTVTVAVTTDWNPWDDDCVITTEEIQEAVSCWLTDTTKNGHTITTTEIQELVNLWLTS